MVTSIELQFLEQKHCGKALINPPWVKGPTPVNLTLWALSYLMQLIAIIRKLHLLILILFNPK